jgi:hypothetical protein
MSDARGRRRDRRFGRVGQPRGDAREVPLERERPLGEHGAIERTHRGSVSSTFAYSGSSTGARSHQV